MIASTTRLTLTVCALSAFAGPARASMFWFDETQGGSRSVSDFAELAGAYSNFVAGADSVFSFSGHSAGTKLSNQYAAQGVTFANTGGGSSGIRPEGGNIAEHITGYDGTYMPHGDDVYVKFDNNNAASPFTVLFNEPVALVGAFVGMGVQGTIHTLTISVFDSADQLLSQRTLQSWLWESNSSTQNFESFFAFSDSESRISRVEILNDATTNYANALIFDNLAFGMNPVPEPATWLLLLCGVGAVWRRSSRRSAWRLA